MLFVLNVIVAMQNRLDTAKERGATATEYAMLVAFIAVVVGVAVTAFGTQLSTFFAGLGTKVGIK